MNHAAFRQSVQHIGVARALTALSYHTLQRVFPFQILRVMHVTLADLSGELSIEAPQDTEKQLSTEQQPSTEHRSPSPERLTQSSEQEGSLQSCALHTAQEMLEIFPDGVLDLSPQFLREALTRKDECLAIFLDHKLASYGWYAHHHAPFSEYLKVSFDPSWVYMYKGFTAPEYRGKRLHALGKIKALKHFTPRGFKGLISYVEVVNYPSLISNHRLGYRDTGFVALFGNPHRPWIFHSPRCRAAGLSISPLHGKQAAPQSHPTS